MKDDCHTCAIACATHFASTFRLTLTSFSLSPSVSPLLLLLLSSFTSVCTPESFSESAVRFILFSSKLTARLTVSIVCPHLPALLAVLPCDSVCLLCRFHRVCVSALLLLRLSTFTSPSMLLTSCSLVSGIDFVSCCVC